MSDEWLFRLARPSLYTVEGQPERIVWKRLLILSGHEVEETADLDVLQDPEEIVSVLLSRSGPWSVVYYRPDLRRLFVGRDVFGRLSLVCAADTDDVVLSDVVQSLPSVCWNEVPYAQVCCIDIDNRCALSTSYLSTYPENILEPWAKIFSSFSLIHSPCKSALLRVSRTTLSSSANGQDIVEEFLLRLVNATRSIIPSDASSTAVAFSGGVDSLLVAIALHEAYHSDRIIDLVNVAFIRDAQHRSIVTDRQRAVVGFLFLRSKFPSRRWRLILVDVTKEELEKKRLKHIVKAAAPALSVLDESLACVLWFALRGAGKDYDSGSNIRSDANVYFVGSGADELFAGYARHRTRFERDGADSIPEECEAELCRLGSRNGGRDARVAVVLKKELRYLILAEIDIMIFGGDSSDQMRLVRRAPFLQDDFVAWVNTLPMDQKWDLTLPRGVGEKLIIRQVLASLGAPHDAPKQAMQFGSGFVKMQNNKALKGSDVSRHLLSAHHSIPTEDHHDLHADISYLVPMKSCMENTITASAMSWEETLRFHAHASAKQ